MPNVLRPDSYIDNLEQLQFIFLVRKTTHIFGENGRTNDLEREGMGES
jgi:hypothetical protein